MVDDDYEELTLIEDALLSEGEVVQYEENGVNALNYLESCKSLPSLIILDLNMPKLNGTETLERLKAHPKFKHIPVIIYSTSMNVLQKEKCIELGAHSYIVKPVNYNDTINTARYFSSFCSRDTTK
jgi:CheY-like chemotaxis protein